MTLEEPDLINVKTNNIAGVGNFKIKCKLSYLSETDNVDVIVRKVSADVDLVLTTQESSKEPGKYLPSAYVLRIDILIDFDFHVNGILIATIANLLESTIKEYIN